jgi:hypothetical protein
MGRQKEMETASDNNRDEIVLLHEPPRSSVFADIRTDAVEDIESIRAF